MSERLLQMAGLVDVLDVAGRIIANPQRNAPAASAAQVLALAHATERFWEIAVEAELLARAVTLEAGEPDPLRGRSAFAQAAHLSQLMREIRGEQTNQENEDGSRHS